MRSMPTLHGSLLIVCLMVASVPVARADVLPGDVIDKTNWEKAQGLLPEPVLDWVKKGDFILDIHALNYRPLDCFPPYQLEAFQTNAGKYELDADGGIVDAETGKEPEHVIGLPFPQIAEDDPREAEKLLQNNHYMTYMPGDLRLPFQTIWLNRSGYMREVDAVLLQMALDGYPGCPRSPQPGPHRKVRNHGLEEALRSGRRIDDDLALSRSQQARQHLRLLPHDPQGAANERRQPIGCSSRV